MEFREAWKLMPDYAEFHYNLAVTWHLLGNASEAAIEFRNARSIESPDGFHVYSRDVPATVIIKTNKGLAINSQDVTWDNLEGQLNDIYKTLAEREACIAPQYLDSFLEVEKVAHSARSSGVDSLCIVPPNKGTPPR